MGLGTLGLVTALAVAGASPVLKTTFGGVAGPEKKTETRHLGKTTTDSRTDGRQIAGIMASRSDVLARNSRNRVAARIPAAVNLADFPVLYGYHNNDNTWQTLSSLPGGFFAFHAAENPTLMDLKADAERPMTACYAKGKFYMMYCDRDDDNGISHLRIEIYDAKTWEHLDSKTITDENDAWTLYLRQVSA